MSRGRQILALLQNNESKPKNVDEIKNKIDINVSSTSKTLSPLDKVSVIEAEDKDNSTVTEGEALVTSHKVHSRTSSVSSNSSSSSSTSSSTSSSHSSESSSSSSSSTLIKKNHSQTQTEVGNSKFQFSIWLS